MESLFRKHRWMQVMWGVLLFVAGAITIIFAATNKGNVDMALSISVAVILFAYGLTIVFSSFIELKQDFFKYEIVVGAFVITAGIIFCLNIDVISRIIVDAIAVSLLTFGVIFLSRAVMALAARQRVWWIPFSIFLSVLFLVGGILCLIFKSKVKTICFIVLGVILIAVGVMQIFLAVKRAIESSRKAITKK